MASFRLDFLSRTQEPSGLRVRLGALRPDLETRAIGVGYRRPIADSEDLDAVIEESHRAIDAFTRGDPAPLQALFSQRHDVTLANPFGPAQRAGSRFATRWRGRRRNSDGRALGFDQLAKHMTADIAFIHELERLEAKIGGSDEITPVSLRCTSVFRGEDDGWKIIHRQADPISGTRAAEVSRPEITPTPWQPSSRRTGRGRRRSSGS